LKISILAGVGSFKVALWREIAFQTIARVEVMPEPIPPVTLPPVRNPQQEGVWLKGALHQWLNQEFIPEAVNKDIAERATQVFVRQRMEGENDVGSLVIAIVTEMKAFDFSKSFFSEFAVANAVSDLLLESLGIDRCCGQ
jgi:hypothetical protein